jgi:sodium-dependent dicarboxylate transporter 2/3/5
MEKWNLHKRIALNIISWFGEKPSYMIWGFMIATAFLSMWISNTATAIMMVAIVISILKNLEQQSSDPLALQSFATAILLGIAYSASIGGMATLVGTPPNLVFSQIYQQLFPGLPPIAFGNWMIFALPLTILLLITFALLLTKVFYKVDSLQGLNQHIIAKEKQALPPMSYEEKIISIIFTLTAFLWMFRKPLTIGQLTIPGWSELLHTPKSIDDGTVAMAMALLLFMIPAKNKEKRCAILDDHVLPKVPWGTLLLFGGGFALAMGFKSSGLSTAIGESLKSLQGTPHSIFISAITTLITFLTELTSNTATTQMILPILGALATAVKIHPLYLMVPATLAASCAFMLPVATPPNAIVFGSGKLKIWDMVKIGLWLNLISIIIISIFTYLFLPYTLL